MVEPEYCASCKTEIVTTKDSKVIGGRTLLSVLSVLPATAFERKIGVFLGRCKRRRRHGPILPAWEGGELPKAVFRHCASC